MGEPKANGTPGSHHMVQVSHLGLVTIYDGAKLVIDKENMLVAFTITSQG
jgi:hypothetical protein